MAPSLQIACRDSLRIHPTPEQGSSGSLASRYVSVIELRNILDAQIRQGNAHGTVAVLHKGLAYDMVKIVWNEKANALVFVSVEDTKQEPQPCDSSSSSSVGVVTAGAGAGTL
jgi:hypothetical protein